jgi:glycosyltransferase involved in cell wall biosynthesis
MKVGILGSRGIPNQYGGFEQFATYLSTGLVKRGVEVWVYNSHNHPYQEKQYHGVNLIHCRDPEDKTGTAGQFIYDLNCINHSRNRGFDVLLQLGYTSSSVWHWRLPRKTKIITNMDGLEWKRAKYSLPVRKFLKYAEKLAVKSSDILVADSEAIREYLIETYNVESTFIPYGADIYESPGPDRLAEFKLLPGKYFLLIARMQPDNHIEEIIRGVLASGSNDPLLVVGSVNNKHGRYLEKKYASGQIRFTGGIFDQELLNQLRFHSRLYFHGHSAGGTNPSLLEAMAASALVCAHDNIFNRSVLSEDALYFSTPDDIAAIISHTPETAARKQMIANNLIKIKSRYNWEKIVDDYLELFRMTQNNYLCHKALKNGNNVQN